MSAGGRPYGSAEQEASAWFARKRRGELSGSERLALQAWLAAGPAHQRAYQDVENVWQQLECLRGDPAIANIRRQPARRRRWSLPGIAAGVAACTAMFFLTQSLLTPRSRVYASVAPEITTGEDLDTLLPQAYRTEIGEQRAITLVDGSTITLDTDSEVRVAFSKGRRLVDLTHGQAFFAVAKDHTRPFIVTAGDERVMAVGTAFDVRLEHDGLSVTLREGRVRIEAPDGQSPQPDTAARVKAADLVPGSKLRTSQHAAWQVARADVMRELSWLHHQLVFDNARLDVVVAEMNRYSSTKIVLGDPALAGVQVGGVFGVDDPDSVADALAHYGLVRVADSTAGRITLLPR
jgi:transmembrane sensor